MAAAQAVKAAAAALPGAAAAATPLEHSVEGEGAAPAEAEI